MQALREASATSVISMRLIILTLATLSAMTVAERKFNQCAREEKICPGGVKPRTPCADGSSPRCPSGRTDTCKPKWKRCADRSKPVRQCVTGKPHCPWTTKNRRNPWKQVGICQVQGSTNYYGKDISHTHLSGPRACANYCADNTVGCNFWTFIRSSGLCYAKSSRTGQAMDQDAVSGNKACGS